MSNKLSEPWSHQEKIELLVNVLQVQHQDIIGFLSHSIRNPPLRFQWNDVALPHGRSLRSCQSIFDNLVPNPVLQYNSQAGPQIASPYPATAPPGRLFTSFEAEHPQWAQQQQPRAIQPRPSRSTDSPNPASTNGENFSIIRTSGPEGDKQRKKRGRPTKEEAEERDRQLAAEGKVYEPKKRKKFRASTGTPVPIGDVHFPVSPAAQATPLPQTVETKEESSSSGKRRSKRQASLTQGDSGSPIMRIAETREERGVESPSDRLLARGVDRDRGLHHLNPSVTASLTTMAENNRPTHS